MLKLMSMPSWIFHRAALYAQKAGDNALYLSSKKLLVVILAMGLFSAMPCLGKDLNIAPVYEEESKRTANMYKANLLEPIVDALRKRAGEPAGVLPASILPLLNNIQINVPSGRPRFPAAMARQPLGFNVVQIDEAYVGLTAQVGYLIALKKSKFPTADEIIEDVLMKYSSQLQKEKNLGNVRQPFLFPIQSYLTTEEGLDQITYIGDLTTAEILTWILLHELSHHLLNHFGPSQTAVLEKLKGEELAAELRELELAADRHSFKLLNEIGFGFNNLRYFFEIYSAFERPWQQLGLEQPENQSDHPSWATRRTEFLKYIEHTPPLTSPTRWIIFRSDKFLDSGIFVTERWLFPQDPSSWMNCGLKIQTSHGSGDDVSQITAHGIEYDNKGAVHMFTRSRSLPEIVIERPNQFTSKLVAHKVSATTGEPYLDSFEVERDSLFMWEEGVYYQANPQTRQTKQRLPDKLVAVPAILKVPLKSALILAVVSAIHDEGKMERINEIVNYRLTEEGHLLLEYKQSHITREQYREELIDLSFKFHNLYATELGKFGMAALEDALKANPLHKFLETTVFTQHGL